MWLLNEVKCLGFDCSMQVGVILGNLFYILYEILDLNIYWAVLYPSNRYLIVPTSFLLSFSSI